MYSTINKVDDQQFPIDYASYRENGWNKPTFPSVFYQPFSFYAPPPMGMSSSAGDISSVEGTNKSFLYPSFDVPSNRTDFYQHPTESTLTIPTSLYSSPIGNHSSTNTRHHSRAMTHQPLEQVLPWNHRSANNFYDNYSSSIPVVPSFTPINASNMNPKLTIGTSSVFHSPIQSSLNFSTNDHADAASYSMGSSIHLPSSSMPSSETERSHSSRRKSPRLTSALRKEILQLKEMKPTIFAWEIRQALLERGPWTSQTLPSFNVIQRFLNQPNKSTSRHKEESIVNSDAMMAAICNHPPPPPPPPPSSETLPSPVIICLSPSSPPELSDSETQSECSICLATYRSGEDVSILACSHEYHSACLKQWMTKHRSCPMCRLDIFHQPQFVTLLL